MKPGIRKLINFLHRRDHRAGVYPRLWQQRPEKRLGGPLTRWTPGGCWARRGRWFAYLFFDAGLPLFAQTGYEVKLSLCAPISRWASTIATSPPTARRTAHADLLHEQQKGVPIGIGTSGISMKFIANQLMTVLMASALWLWNASFVDRQLAGARWVVVIGWLINFAAVPLILLVAFHRPLVQRIAAFFIRLGHRMRLVKDPEVAALRVNTALDSYHASVLRLSRHPRQIAIQLGLSALSVLGLMSVILFVYRAFGESGTPWYQLLTISFPALSRRQLYPLPGASGAQENGCSCSITGGCSPRARQAWRSWYGVL